MFGILYVYCLEQSKFVLALKTVNSDAPDTDSGNDSDDGDDKKLIYNIYY